MQLAIYHVIMPLLKSGEETDMPARLIRRKKETIYSDIIKLFFFFTPFFFGLFYEYAACICAVVLLLLLLYLIDRQKKLSIRFNMLLTALLALLAGYLLTPFWAVDSLSLIHI